MKAFIVCIISHALVDFNRRNLVKNNLRLCNAAFIAVYKYHPFPIQFFAGHPAKKTG